MSTMHIEPASCFVTVNGVRLHYLEWGDPGNPPVILLHGLSSNCHNWDFLCRALAGDYHLFALDQRGHGDSGRPAGGYHPTDYAADLAAFRSTLALERVALVGHSMGGRISLLHLAESVSTVAGLALIDVGPASSAAGIERVTKALLDAPEGFGNEQEAFDHIRRLRPRYSNETLANRVRYALRRDIEGRLSWKYDRGAMLETVYAAPTVDWWACLTRVSCPVLVIRGEQSDVLQADMARRMLEMMPEARLVEIPSGSHAVPFEDTAVCEVAIRKFLSELPSLSV